METKYDIIVGFFLNNWFISVVILACVVLIAIPQLRDGIKMLYDMVRNVFKRLRNNDVYVYEFDGEKVTLTRKLKSKKLDVIIIDTVSHDLGIQSEYAWLKKYYPKFEHPMQFLNSIETEQGKRVFDVFPISKEDTTKEIYFDITSFYYEPIEWLMTEDAHITHRIKELYRQEK